MMRGRSLPAVSRPFSKAFIGESKNLMSSLKVLDSML